MTNGPIQWNDPSMQAGENQAYAEGLAAFNAGEPVAPEWAATYGAGVSGPVRATSRGASASSGPKLGATQSGGNSSYSGAGSSNAGDSGGATITETPCGNPGADPEEVQQALDKLNNNGAYQRCCAGTTTSVPPTGTESPAPIPFPTRSCVVKWTQAAVQDLRFITKWGNTFAAPDATQGWLSIDAKRDRAIVVLTSSSGPVVCVMAAGTGTAQLLMAWDSPTPSDFGGDGHAWWALYYITPTPGTDYLDFAGTTGPFRQVTFVKADQDLSTVDVSFVQQLSYTGSHFHFASESVSVDQSSIYGDFVWLFIDAWYRSIDNVTQDKYFHFAPMPFNHDNGTVNAQMIPLSPGGGVTSSIDWCFDSKNDAFLGHSFTMGELATATDNGTFPGSVRCLATAASVKLSGRCPIALLA